MKEYHAFGPKEIVSKPFKAMNNASKNHAKNWIGIYSAMCLDLVALGLGHG